MKPTPIPDIYELPAEAVIYCLQGTIKQIFGRKDGTIGKGPNKGKPWALQNITITDGHSDIEVQLKDGQPEIPKSWMGRGILIEAHQGDKGWTGVYAVDDDYTDPATRKVKVTSTGAVSLLDQGGQKEQAQRPQKPASQQHQQHQQPTANEPPAHHQQQAQTQPRQRQQEPAPEHQPETAEEAAAREKAFARKQRTELMEIAYQVANLQQLCLNTVETYTAPRFEKMAQRVLTPAERHAWAMNMSIEMCKQGGLRLCPRVRLLDPATQKPNPPQEPTVPKQWEGKPWPKGAVPDEQTGAPIDPETGNFIF